MHFRPGNGMYMMMVFMLMHSLLIPTRCGGTGASAIRGDGIRPGTIAVGMDRDIIGVVGLIIIATTIILITITTIILIMPV